MDIYYYKLQFRGPTHFGLTGIDLENLTERVDSDTFFSALMNAAHVAYGSSFVSDYIEQFTHRPSFLVSSLFIYNGATFFLPRPLADINVPWDLKRILGKKLKKIKWIDLESFQKWTTGTTITKEDIDNMHEMQEKYKNTFMTDIRPRVSLDRETLSSNIYHCGYLYYRENSGLYGFVAFRDEPEIERFKNFLAILGGIGLGGEKTYGCGTFNISVIERLTIPMKTIMESKTDTYTLLSLYHPSDTEINSLDQNLIAYDLMRKRGWITSGRYALTLKRKSVGFIGEGSVFKIPVGGRIVDVTPDNIPPDILEHKAYRYGHAFTAPFAGLT